jgi:hypothetical protein
MRSGKRYSNVTFSKRVDHDSGVHRTPRAPAEPAKCGLCGAVYSERRWTLAAARRKPGKHRRWRPGAITVCPACKKKREGLPAGFVVLSGKFLASSGEQIERLIRNEADRAAVDNPLAQVMNRITDEQGRVVFATTTEHLAQRLGHALEKAFAGEVRFDFSHENKLARVYWHRD